MTTPAGLIIDYEHDFLTSVTAGDDQITMTRAICGRLEAIERGSERSTFTYDGQTPAAHLALYAESH